MVQVWIYVVGASNGPDHVSCVVPWRVDEDMIFFGPCKKRIRENLRGQFLGPSCNHNKATDALFIVGVNASNKEEIRKVVWAGRLSEVMTFAEAYRRFKEDYRFKKLREHKCSPLHVCPVFKDGKLIGYEHMSNEHIKNEEWVSDFVSKWPNSNVLVEGRKLMLRQGTPWQAFDRDCCMLLENVFFASGQGIEFDKEALDILREAQDKQDKKADIDAYAVFGRNVNGDVNGLRGNVRKLAGKLANRFIAWLEDRSHKVAKHQRSEGYGPAKSCCT